MQLRSIAALALLAIFSFPIAAGAVTTTTTTSKKMMKPKKTNSKTPGSPGYTNSSPLGSAQKSKKKAAKKAAKTS
jgi:hypothetical protein